jgi:hypothetical protein
VLDAFEMGLADDGEAAGTAAAEAALIADLVKG